MKPKIKWILLCVLLAGVLYLSTAIFIAALNAFLYRYWQSALPDSYSMIDVPLHYAIIIGIVSGVIALGSLAGILWIIIRKIRIRLNVKLVLSYTPLVVVFAAGVWCLISFLYKIATGDYGPQGDAVILWTLNGLIAYCFFAGIAVICSSAGMIYIHYRRKAKKQGNAQPHGL